MKFQATVELKDDKRCDGCPFLDEHGSLNYCRHGEFSMTSEREERPCENGYYQWHTPRPRGCPLKPIHNSAETAADLLRMMKERQAMPQLTKDEVEK